MFECQRIWPIARQQSALDFTARSGQQLECSNWSGLPTPTLADGLHQTSSTWRAMVCGLWQVKEPRITGSQIVTHSGKSSQCCCNPVNCHCCVLGWYGCYRASLCVSVQHSFHNKLRCPCAIHMVFHDFLLQRAACTLNSDCHGTGVPSHATGPRAPSLLRGASQPEASPSGQIGTSLFS